MSSLKKAAAERQQTNRRLFLQYLATSPLFAGMANTALADTWSPTDEAPYSLEDGDLRIWDMELRNTAIKTPAEALDLFDLELACRRAQPPAHFGFIASGVDGNATLKANRADFQKIGLVSRRMRGPFPADTRINLFGEDYTAPIFTCPAGAAWTSGKGVEGLAKATAAQGNPMVFSYAAAEASAKANGGKVPWAQLYCDTDFDKNLAAIRKAEEAGSKVLVLTVDIIGLRKSIMFERLRRSDRRQCIECHDTPAGGSGAGTTGPTMKHDFDWDYMRRIKDSTKMKVIPKGILAAEDAALCVKHGLDGVFVSNHGGRADDFGVSTISVLPDVVKAVGGKIPVFMDGGIRRGVDVAKALALGATAVGVGRPWLWGLGGFGQAGVERMLDLLRTETQYAMMQAGTATLKDLTPAMIRKLT